MKLARIGAAADPVVRWFAQRGCGSLLRGTGRYRVTTERAYPALLVLFLLMMLVLVPAATPAEPAPGFAISLGVLLAAWLLGRVVRRGEPLWSMGRVRWTEVLAFIVGPMIAVAIPSYAKQTDEATFSAMQVKLLTITTVGVLQVILITTVLLVTNLGLVSLSRWLMSEFLQSIRLTGTALAASLPVILGVVFFFFLNPGVWLIIGRLPTVAYIAAILLLLLLTGAFLGSRSQFDLATLTTFAQTSDVRDALADTPLEGDAVVIDEPTRCPLDQRQRINLRLLAILSKLLVAGVIALAVFSFFMVLGYITIDATAIKGWTKNDPSVFLHYKGAGRVYILSWEHVKVAGFLATFAAMNFSLASATDARLGQATNDRSSLLVRQACAMRLALLRRPAAGSPT